MDHRPLTEEQLVAELEKLRSAFFRWALVFFVPLWIGVYATLVAIVLTGLR